MDPPAEQKGPEPLARLVLKAGRWFERGFSEKLKARGWAPLSMAQFLACREMGSFGTRPADLARRLGVSRQAAHQMLNELTRLGLAEPVPDPNGPGAGRVRLGTAGKARLKAAERVLIELEAEMAVRVGPANLRTLRGALEEGLDAAQGPGHHDASNPAA